MPVEIILCHGNLGRIFDRTKKGGSNKGTKKSVVAKAMFYISVGHFYHN
jgi:hypothetical protein